MLSLVNARKPAIAGVLLLLPSAAATPQDVFAPFALRKQSNPNIAPPRLAAALPWVLMTAHMTALPSVCLPHASLPAP